VKWLPEARRRRGGCGRNRDDCHLVEPWCDGLRDDLVIAGATAIHLCRIIQHFDLHIEPDLLQHGLSDHGGREAWNIAALVGDNVDLLTLVA
jgi:hypothetical protein